MKLIDVLKEIPVYPESIRLGKRGCLNFASDTPICEDEGLFSWISQEAKDDYLKRCMDGQPHTRRTI
jgi:hypothetical protein